MQWEKNILKRKQSIKKWNFFMQQEISRLLHGKILMVVAPPFSSPIYPHHLPSATPKSTFLFLFRKEQASAKHGMHVEVGLIYSQCVKTEYGNSVWGLGLQKPTKALGKSCSLLGVSEVEPVKNLSHMCRGPRQITHQIPGCPMSSCDVRFFVLHRFPCDVL